MNKEAMFDFAIEQHKEWKETNDIYSRIAWVTARHMIEIAGLKQEYLEYKNKKEDVQ